MLPITVAIPTHNRPRFLRRAVASVLAQTFTDFELIVLDNGSVDRGWRDLPELADPRVRLICHETNIGLVNNWNAAVAAAGGAAVNILHDDDYMHPRFLEAIVARLDASPTAGMAYARGRRVDIMGNELGLWEHPEGQHLMRGREFILWSVRRAGTTAVPSGVVIRKSAYEAVGPYGQPPLLSSFDASFYLRVARRFDVAMVDDVLIDYTLHPSQISEDVWRRQILDGWIDASLETLGASGWLLANGDVSPDESRALGEIVAAATNRLCDQVWKRAQRLRTF